MRPTPPRPRAILPLVAAAALLLAACQNVGGASTAPSTAASAAASATGGIELTVSHTAAGDALAGAGGKTLYILTKDSAGTSSCTAGVCATAWPALKGEGSQVQAGAGVSGTFGTTTWADGTKQVTHNGQPLYYYSADPAPGDANGQGSGGVWFIAPVGDVPLTPAAGGSEPSKTPYFPGY